MPRLLGVIQIALSLLMVMGLAMGCSERSGETRYVPVVPKITKIATVQRMWVSSWTAGIFGTGPPYGLCVELKPTESALANKVYVVELYEKGHLRDSTTVSWNQPELNVLKEKMVILPVTRVEYNAYVFEDISHIFSIKVCE